MRFKYNPNIYSGDLDPVAVHDAIEHARAEFPLESCGAIIDDVYVPFVNTSHTPEAFFVVSDPVWFRAYTEGRVDCIVHSHNDVNRASLSDQQHQQELQVPSLIINLRNKSVIDCIVFGLEKEAPLEGRPFFYGAFDCFSLVRDYLKLEHNAVLPTPPHEWEFWVRGENPVEQMIHDDKTLPLTMLPQIPPSYNIGDVLLYKDGGTKHINHMGVVCGAGLVLHHTQRRISGKFPITYIRKYLTNVMRLK